MTINPTTEKQSFVYVFHATGTSLCKIGVTTDVLSRLRAVQTGNPYKVVVLATWPGSPRLEKTLHRHFAKCRQEGEWFEMPPFSGKAIWDIVHSHKTGKLKRVTVRKSYVKSFYRRDPKVPREKHPLQKILPSLQWGDGWWEVAQKSRWLWIKLRWRIDGKATSYVFPRIENDELMALKTAKSLRAWITTHLQRGGRQDLLNRIH